MKCLHHFLKQLLSDLTRYTGVLLYLPCTSHGTDHFTIELWFLLTGNGIYIARYEFSVCSLLQGHLCFLTLSANGASKCKYMIHIHIHICSSLYTYKHILEIIVYINTYNSISSYTVLFCFPDSIFYVPASTVRTLFPNNSDIFTHLLNPIKYLK